MEEQCLPNLRSLSSEAQTRCKQDTLFITGDCSTTSNISDFDKQEPAMNKKQSPELNEKSKLAYIVVGLLVITMIERIFIKDEVLFSFMSTMFGIIIGYYFRTPKLY